MRRATWRAGGRARAKSRRSSHAERCLRIKRAAKRAFYATRRKRERALSASPAHAPRPVGVRRRTHRAQQGFSRASLHARRHLCRAARGDAQPRSATLVCAPRSAEASDAAAGGRDSMWAILPRLHWLSPTTAVQEVRRRLRAAAPAAVGCANRSAMPRVGARALRGIVIASRNIRDGMRARARALGRRGTVGIVDAARSVGTSVYSDGPVPACLRPALPHRDAALAPRAVV